MGIRNSRFADISEMRDNIHTKRNKSCCEDNLGYNKLFSVKRNNSNVFLMKECCYVMLSGDCFLDNCDSGEYIFPFNLGVVKCVELNSKIGNWEYDTIGFGSTSAHRMFKITKWDPFSKDHQDNSFEVIKKHINVKFNKIPYQGCEIVKNTSSEEEYEL